MKELAEFIVGNIATSAKFSVSLTDEEGHVNVEIKTSPETIGLIIGKGGNTIKAIQTLLRVRGRIEDKLVNVTVSEV